MTIAEILAELELLGSPKNQQGMVRYGIVTKKGFGVSAPDIRALAKRLKAESVDRHSLAAALWATEIHDARALAYLIDDPKLVSPQQMDEWAGDFDNWAICDGTCGHLFSRTPFAYQKAFEWSRSDTEFVKRAGIVLMAWLAVHDKKAENDRIAAFLPVLEGLADDGRNFVKKAVSWSLRQIGKRNRELNAMTILVAEQIKQRGTSSARWIASDVLRELRSDAVAERLRKRSSAAAGR